MTAWDTVFEASSGDLDEGFKLGIATMPKFGSLSVWRDLT
jgi:hypothetical protein